MLLFTLKKFLLLTSLIKAETTFQEGTWAAPEQRAEAPKTISMSWGHGGEESMPWPPPGLVAPGLPARLWCFGGSCCFSETISAFCRAEPVVFFQVTPAILTACLAWGLHRQLGVSPGGSLVSLNTTVKNFQHWAGMHLQVRNSLANHVLQSMWGIVIICQWGNAWGLGAWEGREIFDHVEQHWEGVKSQSAADTELYSRFCVGLTRGVGDLGSEA